MKKLSAVPLLLLSLSLLAGVFLVLPSAPVSHATGPTLVQSKYGAVSVSASPTTDTVAFTSNPTSGDLLAVMIRENNLATTSVAFSASDTLGSTWTVTASQCFEDGNLWYQCSAVAYASAKSTGADSISVTETGATSTTLSAVIEEWSLNAASFSDNHAVGNGGCNGASCSASTSTSATVVNSFVAIATVTMDSGGAGSWTAGTSFTLDTATGNCAVAGNPQQCTEYSTSVSTSTNFPMTTISSDGGTCTTACWVESGAVIYTSGLSNTVTIAEPSGASGYCYIVHYTTGGTPTTQCMTAGSHSLTSDSGTFLYPEASNYHAAVQTSTLQYSAAPLTYGLVGYWPLQEGSGTSAYDLSHNNNTGTLTNSPTWSATGGPFTGTGYLNFTKAASSYLNVPSGPSISTSGSISLWLNEANWNQNGGTEQKIISDGISCGTTNSLYISLHASVGLHFRYGGTTQTGNTYAAWSGAYSFAKHSWHMVSATWQPSGSNELITLYADGISEASATTTSSLQFSVSSPNWQLSGLDTACASYGNQGIADASIYNRALSASEISQLYAQTSPQTLENKVFSSGNTYTFNFYKQGPITLSSPTAYKSIGQSLTAGSTGTYWADAQQITFTAAPVNPTLWDGAYTIAVTGTLNGNAATLCSLTTTIGGGSLSCSAYPDVASTATLPASFASTYQGNWVAIGANTYSVKTVAATFTVGYALATPSSTEPDVGWLLALPFALLAVAAVAKRRRH